MFSNEKNSKKLIEYLCEKCDFVTSNKNDYNRHIKTKKHISNDSQCFSMVKTQKNSYECVCGKKYMDNSGLWRHKKKCNINVLSDIDNNDESVDKDQLILMLVKQNSELIKETSEFKNMMMEVIKNGTHNTTHTNSHNKTFNLQFFLNETCKDAMNIMDFVDSVKLQLSDLENVGKIGYVEGISSIIVKNLNSLDETKRPVHCTDAKREVMYVKDEDKWEKENENKQKMRKVIKHIAHKNSKLLNDFKNKHPDCVKSESRYSDKYDKLVIEAMGGKGDNDLEKEDKIIKNIAKEVTIDSKA
jgi:hypothetical protein